MGSLTGADSSDNALMNARYPAARIALIVATLLASHTVFAQFVQQGPKLVGSGTVGASLQGDAVAVSADGNTAIIGGRLDNLGLGAAWIWTRSGGVWTQQAKLVGTGGVYGRGYMAIDQGRSVAISGDGNTVIVGGIFDNDAVGAVWIWTRSEGVWTQQGPKLVGSGYVPNFADTGCCDGVATADVFQGASVALSADGNTAIVGGPGDNRRAGAVWVWTRSEGLWRQQGFKLVGSGAVKESIGLQTVQQGSSVALSGDANTAIVGGPGDGERVGALWVWTRSGGVWTQQGAKLVGSDALRSFQGTSVALSADGNTAIAGGPFDNDIGAAWVWTRSGGVWTQQGSKLIATGASSKYPNQGWSVSLSGDGNRAIVGAPFDGSESGSAWVWNRRGGVWIQQGDKLVGSDAVGKTQFGASVSLSSDGKTAIVGDLTNFYYPRATIGAAWVFAFGDPVPVARRRGVTH